MDTTPQVEIKVRDEDDRPLALCRCGQSRTKPFCDASHKEADFSSCPRATAT